MIPFNNLHPQREMIASELNEAIQRVLDSGWYILGPEVEAFEAEFAAYHGVAHAVGVANGTDAIELALRAYGVGPGDEVITVSHTAMPTITAIERAGGVPVMVDIDPETYTINPEAVVDAITPHTAAVIPVHLYGQTADLGTLKDITAKHGLLLMEDCAQSHGATFDGRMAGTVGQMASFSFYPTKNLGAYGDGGAIITDDAAYAAKLRQLRNYGQTQKYHHAIKGMNSRLDEMQAAILRVKLAHLDQHNALRREVAAWYDAGLEGVTLPVEAEKCYHVYHLYVVRHPRRDGLMSMLRERGIGTLIHYPIPNHLQEACSKLGYSPGDLPVTEQVASEIVSLPLYVGLTEPEVTEVIEGINEVVKELGD